MSTTTEDLEVVQLEAPPAPGAPEGAPAPGAPEAGPRKITLGVEEERPLTTEEIVRPSVGALMTTLGASFLVGGMFTGFSPRIFAAIGGLAGVAMAVWAARAKRRVGTIQILSLVIVFLVAIFALIFGGGGLKAVTNLTDTVGEAISNARLRRPPAPFDTGWKGILPLTLGLIGYAAAWVGSVGRKPAVGVLVPIPIIAFASIAQPAEMQIPSGIVAFVTFVLGLAIIYRADRGEGEGVSTAYEIKRAARTLPLIMVLVVALVGLSRTNLLFPEPLYDPTEKAELPRAVPLEGVIDRPLFNARSRFFTGPWRGGVLDVYDGQNWRLPPYSASTLTPVPASGILDPAMPRQQRVEVTVAGLEGTVLPLPARLYGIVARGPTLVVDPRTDTVRVEVGQVSDGLEYAAAFALLPTEDELKAATTPPNPEIAEIYLDTPNQPPPPGVQALLDQAPEQLWQRLDFVREELLATVTATGQGLPAPVPPSKVEDMFTGTKEATPFEIVAAQALLARWAGVPSRIGYGFDKGEELDGSEGGPDNLPLREYRPKHGAAWLEVYFQGYGWFPVTGLPKRAKASIGNKSTQLDADILPGNDIAIELIVPLRVVPANLFFKQAQKALLLVSPFVVTFLLVWLLWPAVYKARRRAKRRAWAYASGRAARIAVAYTEFRDRATDLAVGDPYATPLAYLRKVVPDEEHRELGWLVTRALWGDLRESLTDDDVLAAEELSRSLQRRMYEAQPFTIRAISVVSRLALRNPYAPELLSPPLRKFELRRALRRIVRIPRLRIRLRRKKETLDEAVRPA